MIPYHPLPSSVRSEGESAQGVGSRAPGLMGVLGGGGVPGQLAISQQLEPGHLPGPDQALALLPVLQPPLPQDGHELAFHLHPLQHDSGFH